MHLQQLTNNLSWHEDSQYSILVQVEYLLQAVTVSALAEQLTNNLAWHAHSQYSILVQVECLLQAVTVLHLQQLTSNLSSPEHA